MAEASTSDSGATTLRKGCRVKLSGLSTAVLNGAEGCIVGAYDEVAGRHPVKLLKPPEAVAAFPSGVKVKPANLERIQEIVSSGQPATKAKKPKADALTGSSHTDDMRREIMGPSAWARGLSPAEQAEWLVDCYRMRVDDDYVWGGGNLHGLYDPDATDDTIVADFLVFCKLAVARGVVPRRWDWGQCLAKASELLRYAFEKEDAKEKYGGENVFSVLGGGRSLRVTGETVYGSSVMAGGMPFGGGADGDGAEAGEAHRLLQEMVESQPLRQLMARQPALFEDVGGVVAWKRLRSALARA